MKRNFRERKVREREVVLEFSMANSRGLLCQGKNWVYIVMVIVI
jgi:hypothetical protein